MADREREIGEEIPDWAPEWVKPDGSRRKGWDLFSFGDAGDFTTEAEYRKTVSKREFLALAFKIGVPLAILGAIPGSLWLAHREQDREDAERIAEQAPRVKTLLLDTLQSDRLENLGLFTDPVQKDIIQMTQNSQEELFSNDTELRDRTRWEIASYVLGLYYHYPTSTIIGYDEYKETGSGKLYFDFLDNTVGEIDQGTISSQSGAQQTNMWVEAYFRTRAFVNDLDASQSDGVYTSRTLLTMGKFVPLQHHSPSLGDQP